MKTENDNSARFRIMDIDPVVTKQGDLVHVFSKMALVPRSRTTYHIV